MSSSADRGSSLAAVAVDEALCRGRLVTSVILTYPNPPSSFCNPAKYRSHRASPCNFPLPWSASGHQEVRMSVVPYDQREGVIWLNGEFVPWTDAKIHVL